MKAILTATNCKILEIKDEKNNDGSITWKTCIFMQGMNVNTVTINKKADSKLIGGVFDLIVECSENPKAFRNGSGAYIENKFKITQVVKDGKMLLAIDN